MFNFMKNLLIGIGGLFGLVMAFIVVMLIGGALWMVLSLIGIIGFGLAKFLGWFVICSFAAIFLLEGIGALIGSSKASD